MDAEEVMAIQITEEHDEAGSDQYHGGVVIHCHSSVLHLVAGSERLACGRQCGETYKKLSKNLLIKDFPSCTQCEKTKLNIIKPFQPAREKRSSSSSMQPEQDSAFGDLETDHASVIRSTAKSDDWTILGDEEPLVLINFFLASSPNRRWNL